MNWTKILVIFRKEMLDLFRDRRTIITAIILPIVLYPFISIFVATIASRQETKIQEAEKIVYVYDQVNSNDSNKLIRGLEDEDSFSVQITYKQSWNNQFKELVENNDIQAFLSLRDTLNGEYERLIIDAYFNNTDEKSQKAYSKIKDIANYTKWDIVSRRLSDLDISDEILEAIQVEPVNIAPPQKILGALLGKFLAYMLIILTISSGAVVASDLVAGEKDRGTLETILVSAASRLELVAGKFLTIITFSFITVFMNLLSMYISTRHILGMAQMDMSQVQLPIVSFLLIFLAMIPLAVLFAAIQLSLSTWSRNVKECSSYQTPLLLIGMMFSMISAFPGFELNYGYALIPIINFSLLLKELLLGDLNLGHYLTVIISTLVLAGASVMISINLFKKENVLFRTTEEKSLKFWGKQKGDIFSTQFVIGVFLLVLMLFYYLGTPWQTKDLYSGLIKTEVLLVLLPVLLIYKLSRTNIKKAARLQGTNPLNFVLTAAAVIPGFIISAYSMQIVNLLYPLPESYLESMQKIMQLHELPIWQTLFIIALLPAICEEMLFRGYVIRGFEKSGIWKAIIISGVLFGIFHLDFFRLLPAALMGIWLGYLLIKTKSIFITMLAHALHNSSTVVLSKWGDQIPFLANIMKNDDIPFNLLIISIAAIIIISWLINKINQPKEFPNELSTG
ncbi:MAG: ABC transporter permease subunit/CPBP intramembrane protease [Candidatus Stygibacter frigidus]|nr:ABC transporter permease subunit/CPBP intramembrane protease [Candidatus Stygibacter frigidus]